MAARCSGFQEERSWGMFIRDNFRCVPDISFLRKGDDRIFTQKLLQDAGYTALSFDWNQTFPNGKQIPIALTDPCALSVKQLSWLRKVGKI